MKVLFGMPLRQTTGFVEGTGGAGTDAATAETANSPIEKLTINIFLSQSSLIGCVFQKRQMVASPALFQVYLRADLGLQPGICSNPIG